MKDNFPALIILAGGSSSRLWPLREKSLLKFLGKPLLELQLEVYVKLGFRNVVVVCNPDNHDPVREILAKFDRDIEPLTFVQSQPRGMGDALLTVEPILDGATRPVPAYVCQVHDIFDQSLHEMMLQAHLEHPQAVWLASYKVENYFPGGYLVVNSDLNVTDIVEKPPRGEEPSNLINIVAHVHPDLRRLLEHIRREYAEGNATDDHYERAMAKLMRQIPFKAVPYTGPWYPIKYPWHVLEAMNYYLGTIERQIAVGHQIADNACIEDGVHIIDPVHIDKGVKILHGADIKGPVYIGSDAYIEEGVHISGPAHIEEGVKILHGADIRGPVYIGPDSLIGQHTQVRESMVSRNCIVGIGSEVNRSYLGEGARLHTAKALDAILADNAGIDEHVNLSAGMITANFRIDAGNVKSTVKGRRIDTGRTKLGAIIGAGAFFGVGAMLMPGVKIGEGSVVGPLTLVLEDVPDNTLYYSKQQYVKKQLSK